MEIDSIDTERSRQPQKRKKSEEIYQPIDPNSLVHDPDRDVRDDRSQLISSPDIPPAVYFSERMTLANKTCWYTGFFLIAVGVVGFASASASTQVWEFHFNTLHNFINLFAGILTLWAGLTRKGAVARRFALWMGAAFFLFGAAGFVFGVHPIVNGAIEARYVMAWSETTFFGRWDHYLHLIVGAILFVGGSFSKVRRVRT